VANISDFENSEFDLTLRVAVAPGELSKIISTPLIVSSTLNEDPIAFASPCVKLIKIQQE